jgi:hypothetical protein
MDLDQGPPSGLDMLAAQIAELQRQSESERSAIQSFIEASRSEIDGLRSDFQNAVTGLETRMATLALPPGEGGDVARVLASRLDVLIAQNERAQREQIDEQRRTKEQQHQADAARQTAEMQRRLEELAAANRALIAQNTALQDQLAKQERAKPGSDKTGNGNGNGDKAGSDEAAADPDVGAVSEQPTPPPRRHRFL